MQVDSYSKSINDCASMTIAIVEQRDNTRLALRIVPSEAEDNNEMRQNVSSLYTPISFTFVVGMFYCTPRMYKDDDGG